VNTLHAAVLSKLPNSRRTASRIELDALPHSYWGHQVGGKTEVREDVTVCDILPFDIPYWNIKRGSWQMARVSPNHPTGSVTGSMTGSVTCTGNSESILSIGQIHHNRTYS